jgi:hypothetical protein
LVQQVHHEAASIIANEVETFFSSSSFLARKEATPKTVKIVRKAQRAKSGERATMWSRPTAPALGRKTGTRMGPWNPIQMPAKAADERLGSSISSKSTPQQFLLSFPRQK